MNLTHEQTNLIITALQNMRAELYINNNLSEMNKVSSVIQNIETEMESKDLSQKKRSNYQPWSFNKPIWGNYPTEVDWCREKKLIFFKIRNLSDKKYEKDCRQLRNL